MYIRRLATATPNHEMVLRHGLVKVPLLSPTPAHLSWGTTPKIAKERQLSFPWDLTHPARDQRDPHLSHVTQLLSWASRPQETG